MNKIKILAWIGLLFVQLVIVSLFEDILNLELNTYGSVIQIILMSIVNTEIISLLFDDWGC